MRRTRGICQLVSQLVKEVQNMVLTTYSRYSQGIRPRFWLTERWESLDMTWPQPLRRPLVQYGAVQNSILIGIFQLNFDIYPTSDGIARRVGSRFPNAIEVESHKNSTYLRGRSLREFPSCFTPVLVEAQDYSCLT